MSQNQHDIETLIDEVTVYPDRALVTRRGTASLKAGTMELIVAGLPATMETESLRALGRGTVAVKLIGVEARERTLVHPNQPSARQIQSELEKAQDEGKALAARDAVLEARAATTRQLADNAAQRYAKALSQGKIALEKTTELLDFVDAQLSKINADRATLDFQKRENAAQQSALASRLQQLQSGRQTRERVVSVLVEAAGDGEWELELSYIVPGANWTPIYDARVTLEPSERELAGQFALSYNAILTQRSGEDWNDVALKLSTARPSLGSLPPKLEPHFIDIERPAMPVYAAPPMPAMAMPAPMMRSRGGSSNDDTAASMMAEPMPVPIEAEEVLAAVKSDGATVEFSLPYRLSVPSDGQPHRTAIATHSFPVKLDYVAIPRRVPLGYLRLKTSNTSGLSLLQGEVNIFRDGTFVGKAQLLNAPPSGEFTLFLGPDEGVQAKRELVAREVDKNFIGSTRRIHFVYKIDLHNLKPHPVQLLVQDQVPVSRSETIKVKLRSTQPEAELSDLGVLSWNITLAAGEKRALPFDYAVESPRDTRIAGLQD